MEELIKSLKILLADVHVMSSITHGFHWNVEGNDFPEWHSKFDEIYSDVYESTDAIAENIRKCGDYAPFTLQRFIEFTSIPDNTPLDSSPKSFVSNLYEVNNYVLNTLYDVFSKANSLNKQGIANFIAERIDIHEKHGWMLRASLKGL